MYRGLNLGLLLFLVACGGGGGGRSSPAPSPEPQAPFAGLSTESDPDGFGAAGDALLTYVYNGVEFYGECVPAARRYYQARYGIALPLLGANGGAYLFWDSVQPIGMVRIPDVSTSLPEPDDMIVWRPWAAGDCVTAAGPGGFQHSNPYGHVAVVVSAASRDSIVVVDSNWVGQDRGGQHTISLTPCDYGWYRPAPHSSIFPAYLAIERLSDIAQIGLNAHAPAINYDGRFIAYAGAVPGSNQYNILLADRTSLKKRNLTVSPSGAVAAGECRYPSISADGSLVSFQTGWSGLLPGDTNGHYDVFVQKGLEYTNSMLIASRNSSGQIGNGDSTSYTGALSADGNWLAFVSESTNFGVTNPNAEVYLKDLRLGGGIRCVSPVGARCSFPSVSADGGVVAFESGGNIWAYHNAAGSLEKVGLRDDGTAPSMLLFAPAVSGDGRYVSFATNEDLALQGFGYDPHGNVYVRDLVQGRTRRASVPMSGLLMNEEFGWWPATFSADGRYIVYSALASNLVPGDTNGAMDVFVRDTRDGVTGRVLGLGGAQGNGTSTYASISGDGRYITFASSATNLVATDPNGTTYDVFVAPNPLLAASPPNPLYSFKMPLPGGYSWKVTQRVGGSNLPDDDHTDAWTLYYSLDFSPNSSPAYGTNIPVYAMHSGYVIDAGWTNDRNGYTVRLDFDGDGNRKTGLTTVYIHLSGQPLVTQGTTIQAGTLLGYMGNTGTTTTGQPYPKHLHVSFKYADECYSSTTELDQVRLEGKALRDFQLNEMVPSTR